MAVGDLLFTSAYPVVSMAKTSRPLNAPASPSLDSDDPLENLTLWLQANGKMLAIAGAVVVAAGLGIYGLRASEAKKQANASTALYAAQAPMQEGNAEAARTALEGVATRYKGTSSGEQAVLLVAQTFYDAGNFDEGIARLQAARSGASAAFAASMEAMTAAGYEGKADFVQAAAHYAKAATAAASEVEKDSYTLSQGRQLMRAGQRAEAIAIFESLQAKEGSPFAQEAAVRLGELRARAG
jgi:predicted negative regulator of RcsB-dependent stress response